MNITHNPSDLRALVAAAYAVLYHDARGQGVQYAEAMEDLKVAIKPFLEAL